MLAAANNKVSFLSFALFSSFFLRAAATTDELPSQFSTSDDDDFLFPRIQITPLPLTYSFLIFCRYQMCSAPRALDF
jgi:hypothetical protein